MITEKQKIAFSFIESNLLWEEICEILNEMHQQELFLAIGRDTKGEDRIHAAGRVDGINMVMSTLNYIRQEALNKNGN